MSDESSGRAGMLTRDIGVRVATAFEWNDVRGERGRSLPARLRNERLHHAASRGAASQGENAGTYSPRSQQLLPVVVISLPIRHEQF